MAANLLRNLTKPDYVCQKKKKKKTREVREVGGEAVGMEAHE